MSFRVCRMLIALVVLATSLTLFPVTTSPAADDADRPRTVRLLLALVWEGRDLQPYNLAALERFRSEFKALQVVHFISPAYFLKGDIQASEAAQQIRAALKPGDRIGVTLGGWKSLVTKSGVIFRGGPTFWGNATRPADCAKDCGDDVPVHVYPEGDLEKMVQTSLDVLEEHGFGRIQGLHTSGWVASPELLEAAAKLGVRYDFSAASAEMLANRARQYPLYGWVKGLWPAVKPHTQPYPIITRTGSLTEMPQSLGAVDYLSVAEIDTLFKEYADLARRDAGRELTFPLVFHQETARAALPLLTRSLQAVFDTATQQNVSLAPLELPGMEIPSAALAH